MDIDPILVESGKKIRVLVNNVREDLAHLDFDDPEPTDEVLQQTTLDVSQALLKRMPELTNILLDNAKQMLTAQLISKGFPGFPGL